jgi:DNA-binding response OmpR family regulator
METEVRPGSLFMSGPLEVDVDAFRATYAGRDLDLSSSQVVLLGLLIKNQHRVTSRDDLAEVLGLSAARSVDVLLSGLRQKIGRDFVRNIRGRGWIIDRAALV